MNETGLQDFIQIHLKDLSILSSLLILIEGPHLNSFSKTNG
jgi:hypothetical protein